jgi:alkylation response protein AidB-like acyl-CoA dehydrogenase
MDFGLSEDQLLFQDALAGFLNEHVPLTRVRDIMESEDAVDAALVRSLAEQGVCGIMVPIDHGGTGSSLLDAVVAAEQLGAAAAPYSFHSAAVMAPLLLQAGGKTDVLAKIADGTLLASVVDRVPAVASGKLNGQAMFAPDATTADLFILLCGEGDGRNAIVLDAKTAGLTRETLWAVDETRRVGELSFDDIAISDDAILDVDAAAIDRVLDAGRIMLAADAVGGAQRSLDEAVKYSMDRKQFERVIGSFQAVKHMCAETYAEVEPVRSLLWYAAFGWDEGRDDAALTAALLKAHASEMATRTASTCVQVFGGMGFTYESDMHIWFKRAGYDRQLLGGPTELRERAAELAYG